MSWIFISYVYLLLYCIYSFLLYVLCIFLITLLYCIAYFYKNNFDLFFISLALNMFFTLMLVEVKLSGI